MQKITSYKNLGSKGTYTILKKPGLYNEMTNEEDKIEYFFKKRKEQRSSETSPLAAKNLSQISNLPFFLEQNHSFPFGMSQH